MNTYTMRHPARGAQPFYTATNADHPALVDPKILIDRIEWNLQSADTRPNHRAMLLMVGVDNLSHGDRLNIAEFGPPATFT